MRLNRYVHIASNNHDIYQPQELSHYTVRLVKKLET